MNPTKLLYLEDFNLLTAQASIVDILNEEGRDVVVVDRTILYPQGGGQPYDQGKIMSSSAIFLVEEVRFVDGIVKHVGKFEKGSFAKSDSVTIIVDEVRRRLNSRLHSAGHVVDIVIHKLGLSWIPVKGFHFPQGPYVEYKGNLDGVDTQKVKGDIERVANEFIKEAHATTLRFIPKDQMSTVCHFVPDYIPEGKPARVVMYGKYGIPCAGTHVLNVSEIQHVTIPKVKPEGENIRVRYSLA